MTNADIKALYKNGTFPWEILMDCIAAGIEYSNAVFKISQALKMDSEQIQEMTDKYDNYI